MRAELLLRAYEVDCERKRKFRSSSYSFSKPCSGEKKAKQSGERAGERASERSTTRRKGERERKGKRERRKGRKRKKERRERKKREKERGLAPAAAAADFPRTKMARRTH